MRLEDIDWLSGKLRVRSVKDGPEVWVPLPQKGALTISTHPRCLPGDVTLFCRMRSMPGDREWKFQPDVVGRSTDVEFVLTRLDHILLGDFVPIAQTFGKDFDRDLG